MYAHINAVTISAKIYGRKKTVLKKVAPFNLSEIINAIKRANGNCTKSEIAIM